jgi:hypothetical protein
MKNAILLLVVLSCGDATWAESRVDAQIVPIESRIQEGAEEDERAAKEALMYLMQSHAIPLAVNASCSNVGVRGDVNIGDFTSGMLSQFVYVKGENAKNWIRATCKNNPKSSKVAPMRDCEITFHQARLEENVLWGWGFRFSANKNSRTIIRKTLFCMVSG